MNKSKIIEWVQKEFLPLELATPIETIEQIIENGIRYLNTHSAIKCVEMVAGTSNSIKIEVPLTIKSVQNVYPASEVDNIMQNHPMWTLLGVQILDNITSDLVNVSTAFKNYKVYIGNDFRWTFENSMDPDVNSYILVSNVPVGCEKLCVVGTRRYSYEEDIKSEHTLEWILGYTKALTKKAEGNLLRKSDIIGVKNDGQQLYTEGAQEQKELEERLAIEGRWVTFGRRF